MALVAPYNVGLGLAVEDKPTKLSCTCVELLSSVTSLRENHASSCSGIPHARGRTTELPISLCGLIVAF